MTRMLLLIITNHYKLNPYSPNRKHAFKFPLGTGSCSLFALACLAKPPLIIWIFLTTLTFWVWSWWQFYFQFNYFLLEIKQLLLKISWKLLLSLSKDLSLGFTIMLLHDSWRLTSTSPRFDLFQILSNFYCLFHMIGHFCTLNNFLVQWWTIVYFSFLLTI